MNDERRRHSTTWLEAKISEQQAQLAKNSRRLSISSRIAFAVFLASFWLVNDPLPAGISSRVHWYAFFTAVIAGATALLTWWSAGTERELMNVLVEYPGSN
jgi:cytochrome c oxidase assembly factor CtaG